MNKYEALNYINDRFSEENWTSIYCDISIDVIKINKLVTEWLERQSDFDIDDVNHFSQTIIEIVNKEIEIRENNPEQKAIWLTV